MSQHVPEPRNLEGALRTFRAGIHAAITRRTVVKTDGSMDTSYKDSAAAFNAYIRTQKGIRGIHRYAVRLFRNVGVPEGRIFLEEKLRTANGRKLQDIAIKPPAQGTTTPPDAVISIGVKSQVASVMKNFRNNFSSTRSDITDFHELFPAQVVGHIQLIALQEVVTSQVGDDGDLLFAKLSSASLARIFCTYARLSGRQGPNDAHQRAERVGLIITDLRPRTPKIYTSLDALIEDGWVTEEDVRKHGLTQDILDSLQLDERFAQDLLGIHASRYPDSSIVPQGVEATGELHAVAPDRSSCSECSK